MITCVLVDDEPPARERLRALLGEAAVEVKVLGEAGNGHEAVALVRRVRPDVLFIDVRMPVLDGFDVVELLPHPRPRVVFVTAYDRHALRAFDVQALDYLTKPVRLSRLNMTLERLTVEMGAASGAPRLLSRLTVHIGRRLRIVSLDDVRSLEARQKLVYVNLAEGSYPTDLTLDLLESRLDPDRFVRIHRSHIVNMSYVRELVPWFAGAYVVRLEGGAELPVARRRVRVVRGMLGLK